jgi:hypothetical protein
MLYDFSMIFLNFFQHLRLFIQSCNVDLQPQLRASESSA